LSGAPSDSRGVRPTTAFGYRAPLDDTRDPAPASGDENPPDADHPAERKPVVGDGTEKTETSLGSKDNDGSRSRGLLRPEFEKSWRTIETPAREQEKSENGYAITDGSPRVLAIQANVGGPFLASQVWRGRPKGSVKVLEI